jgi:hypothetical protein
MIATRLRFDSRCQAVHTAGKRSHKQLRITEEQTLHAFGRLCPRLYVKWQGEWLRSKEYNTFEFFWYDLTSGNL